MRGHLSNVGCGMDDGLLGSSDKTAEFRAEKFAVKQS